MVRFIVLHVLGGMDLMNEEHLLRVNMYFSFNINTCSITITKQITRCVNITLNNGEHVSFQYVQRGKKNRNKTERR